MINIGEAAEHRCPLLDQRVNLLLEPLVRLRQFGDKDCVTTFTPFSRQQLIFTFQALSAPPQRAQYLHDGS